MFFGSSLKQGQSRDADGELAIGFRIIGGPALKTETPELVIEIVMKTGEGPLGFFVGVLGGKTLTIHVDDAAALPIRLRRQKHR